MTRKAGMFLGLSPRTLEKHRVLGTGPIYRKLGGRVVYAISDLQAWADLGVRRSTEARSASLRRLASGGADSRLRHATMAFIARLGAPRVQIAHGLP
ncbi:helix-turn-helix transcriptional regulator [Phenylobacterium sp.]|uniref:helix-turn-helix transcriptional regulator n=1 Tax=Phenylobacterium sp. TaxID=1871053 RepID=UPI00356A59A8